MNPVCTYNFFFHPLHESHTLCAKSLSVIANIALTYLSCGVYAFLFAGVQAYEWGSVQPIPKSGSGFVGCEALAAKQADHLGRLQALAARGQWQHLASHTSHPDSGFDWWMFPSDRGSLGQRDLYKVSPADIAALRRDHAFMHSYRDGVKLVARSWGWDLDTGRGENRWSGYSIRLEKMLYSLRLFGQDDLRHSLSQFVRRHTISLAPWAQRELL